MLYPAGKRDGCVHNGTVDGSGERATVSPVRVW